MHHARDALMRRIRAFFYDEGFVEVETPIRMPTPCMEEHINAEPSGNHWLRTSPEIYHKQVLAAGAERIFEIGKCFRQGERGALHHPEYTMLEWYRAGGDSRSMADDTRRLLRRIARQGALGGRRPGPAVRRALRMVQRRWAVYRVRDLFVRHAGWDPVAEFDAPRFDLDMVEKVEPVLPTDVPVMLTGYPAERCALACLCPGDPAVADRWELYLGGIEIANAYSELTDPVEMRARFERWGESRRAAGLPVYPLDEAFLQSLERMPPSGGCALGIDRLLMILIGGSSLDQVLPFGRSLT